MVTQDNETIKEPSIRYFYNNLQAFAEEDSFVPASACQQEQEYKLSLKLMST